MAYFRSLDVFQKSMFVIPLPTQKSIDLSFDRKQQKKWFWKMLVYQGATQTNSGQPGRRGLYLLTCV